MAAESCSVVDDGLYLIALCNGRNADGLPDEEYAAELQLQEVIVSSAMAATALPLLPAATSYESTVGAGECSSSTSPIPPLAPATDDDDHHATVAMKALKEYAAEHQLQEVIMSSAMAAPALPLPPAATSYESTVGAGECSSSTSPIPPLAPATDDDHHATAATQLECFPSSAGSSPIPATFLFCKICMDAVPPSDAHSASRGCGHAFCATCLAGYIRVKIQDRIADVRCPGDGCGSVLDPELCQGMLPGEAFEAWCAVMCESMLLGATKVYCPFKDCSAMMVDDIVGGGDIAESECPSCKRLFCVRCGVPWHTGVRCAEYEQLAVGDRGKEDLVVMEMAMGEKWKRCPHCKFFVQKSDGCMHITCRCGFEFCYGCGKPWGDSHSSCSAA